MSASNLERWLMNVRPAFLAVVLKKIFKVKRRIYETPAGKMWIDPVSVLGLALSDSNGFESEMRATVDAMLPKNGVFLDIGANEGFFTLYASRQAAQVVAVEPQKRAVNCIRKNIDLNGMINVRIYDVALGRMEESRDFHLANDTNTGSSGFVKMVRYDVPVEKVKVMTLDNLMEQLDWPVIDLAKVDIEGAEYELLLGASETLKKGFIKSIAIELHPKQLSSQGYSSELVINILKENAYHIIEGAPTLVYALDSRNSE
jgi:FkbM family methyltransferase